MQIGNQTARELKQQHQKQERQVADEVQHKSEQAIAAMRDFVYKALQSGQTNILSKMNHQTKVEANRYYKNYVLGYEIKSFMYIFLLASITFWFPKFGAILFMLAIYLAWHFSINTYLNFKTSLTTDDKEIREVTRGLLFGEASNGLHYLWLIQGVFALGMWIFGFKLCILNQDSIYLLQLLTDIVANLLSVLFGAKLHVLVDTTHQYIPLYLYATSFLQILIAIKLKTFGFKSIDLTANKNTQEQSVSVKKSAIEDESKGFF